MAAGDGIESVKISSGGRSVTLSDEQFRNAARSIRRGHVDKETGELYDMVAPGLSRVADQDRAPTEDELYDAFEAHARASVDVDDIAEELKAAKDRKKKADTDLYRVGERLRWAHRQ